MFFILKLFFYNLCIYYYYAGSRVHPRVFCARRYGRGCRLLPVADWIRPTSVGLYISHPLVMCSLSSIVASYDLALSHNSRSEKSGSFLPGPVLCLPSLMRSSQSRSSSMWSWSALANGDLLGQHSPPPPVSSPVGACLRAPRV